MSPRVDLKYLTPILCFSWSLTALRLDLSVLMIAISLTQCILFHVMIACLGGLIRSLRQKSPAHANYGKQVCNDSPQRRRAVVNVLAVVVPSILSYLPISLMSPFVVCIYNDILWPGMKFCTILQLSEMFPHLSVFIGPLFYLSKARQTCCSKKQKKNLRSKRLQ